MKPLLLLSLLLTSCVTTKSTRTLSDGTVVESATYGLSERAGALADAVVRDRLRIQPSK